MPPFDIETPDAPPDFSVDDADYNGAEVRRRLERLCAEYDPSVARGRWPFDADDFSQSIENAREGYIGGAYCFVHRAPENAPELSESMPADAATDETRVLLAMGRDDGRWGPPGGGLEGFDPGSPGSGETFEAAARREVREETGVDCTIDDCHAVYHTVGVCEGRDERTHVLYVCFEGHFDGGGIDVQESELAGAAWFGNPPERRHYFAESWVDDGCWPGDD